MILSDRRPVLGRHTGFPGTTPLVVFVRAFMDPHNPLSEPPGSSSSGGPVGSSGGARRPVTGLPDDAAATVISAEQQWLGEAIPAGPGATLCGRLFPPVEVTAEGVAATGLSLPLSPVGVELDHFIIDERSGVGGMGAGFRARAPVSAPPVRETKFLGTRYK